MVTISLNLTIFITRYNPKTKRQPSTTSRWLYTGGHKAQFKKMYVPGIDTYLLHYEELYESSKILLHTLHKQGKNEGNVDSSEFRSFNKKLIVPFILTMYSFLECFLSELEDTTDRSSYTLPYSREKRPDITERPFILYETLTGKKFDKSTSSYSDYKYSIKVRNLITHASGEHIKWSRRDVAPLNVEGSMNSFHYEKEYFKKNGLEKHITRNKEADKIIKYLASKSLVAKYHEGRHCGWLHYIALPTVAYWYWKSSISIIGPILIELAKNQDNSIVQFTKNADRVIFDNSLIDKGFEPLKDMKFDMKTRKNEPEKFNKITVARNKILKLINNLFN